MIFRWVVRSALVMIPLSSFLGCAADTTAPLSFDSGGAAGISVNATPNTLKGTVGVPFAGGAGVVFSVSGGTAGASYYWTVTGPLPPGLVAFPQDNLNPSNTLTLFGMPSTGGLYPLQITVHTAPNHALLVSGANFPIEIAGDSNSSPVIPSLSLTWLTGVAYQQALTATGGRTPYASWFATGLPPEITLNAQTGTLSGTPATPGTYNVTVSVVDAAGRTGVGTVSLTVQSWTLAQAKGTWTGVITTDPHPLKGKRLSLLFNDQGIVQQGTMDATVLATSTQPLSFTLGGGQLSGPISILGWHLVCDPTSSGDLGCVGHDLSGVTPRGDITLRKINGNNQDIDAPLVVSGVFAAAAADGTGGPRVTVTFSELMSGTGAAGTSITLSGGPGTIGTPTFAATDPTALDARTLTIPLSQLQSSTTYTLTLNPSGQTGLRDIAGNSLATKAVPFTTGALNANQSPTATGQTLTAALNTARSITLAGFDPEGGTLTFQIVSPPRGTLTGTAPNLTYTSSVVGADSFIFTVTDPGGNTSSQATITITTRAANQSPAASLQSVSGIHDRSLAITLAGSDPDVGDYLTAYTIVSNPTNGTLTGGTGATKTYTPRTGYTGPDSFQFTVTDSASAVSAPATVAIAVTNRPPTASSQSLVLLKDVSSLITLTGSDPDGDTLTYTMVDSVPSSTHGAITGGTSAARTYFPPAGYSGADTFTFTVSDGVASSAEATINIAVSGNQPPTANTQTITFLKRQSTTTYDLAQWAIMLTGSQSAVAFRIVTWPTNGILTNFNQGTTYSTNYDLSTYTRSTVTATTSSSVDTTTGNITVSPSGSPSWVVYIPNLCHVGDFAQDAFTFVAIDADGLASFPATVTMNSTANICQH